MKETENTGTYTAVTEEQILKRTLTRPKLYRRITLRWILEKWIML
jgi:hypothetical protein